MKHLFVLAVIIAALICAVPASASVATATSIAQGYQNDQCRDIGGVWWHCYNNRYVAQGCTDLGNTYYDCQGAFTQQWIAGGLRYCNLYVHVQKGTGSIIYHWDSCLH